MSRCFSFPPPGYERQHKLEDLILSKEAKHKEKREKKDKDKKKDKEKKEKDGNEKQRDKKDKKGKHRDKKEKHRDKKKVKVDWGKDKERSSILEKSTIVRKLEERIGEKVHPEVHNKYSNVEDGGKCSTFFQGQNGKNPLQSILHSQGTNEARVLQELDKRIKDNEKGRGSQFLHRVANVGTNLEAADGTPIRKPSQVLEEEKHNVGDTSHQGKILWSQGHKGEFMRKTTVQNLTQVAKSKDEGIPRPLERHDASRLEENEKYKEIGGNNNGDKWKDRDKKSHGKDKHKEKEQNRKKEKASNMIENEKSEPDKSKISGRNNLAGTAFNKSVNVLKDAVGPALNEGSTGKRKETDTNGFLHESEIRPNKVQMLALHQSIENGRKLEASGKFSSDKHAVRNNVWLDHHGRLNNGGVEAKKPSPPKPNPSCSNMLNEQIVLPPKTFSSANEALRMPKKDHNSQASKRPPHPDSNYMSQILTVPTVGDWFEDDDQEWLFCEKGPPKKPVSEPVMVEDIHVWSEAVHIESADVCALPYVIPY